MLSRGLARGLGIVGAERPGTHGEGLLPHVGIDDTGMDRVDADAIALAAELQRRRLGEQRDSTLGQRIERV
jgi:hypothetical protein